VWGGQSQPKPLGSNLHNRRRGPEVKEEEEAGMEERDWGNRRRHGWGGSGGGGSARKRWWEDTSQQQQVGKTAEAEAEQGHALQGAKEPYPRHYSGVGRERREEDQRRTAMARAFHQPPPVQRPCGSALRAPTAQGARWTCSTPLTPCGAWAGVSL
jgi:hypothetical protein